MSIAGFLRDRSGNMAILFAGAFAASAAISVVAVDTASLYHERRQVQAGVDLAAISAVSDPVRAAVIAQAALVEAGLLREGDSEGLTVITGHYDPTLSDIARRFIPDQTPLNAVQVRLERPGTLHFAHQLFGSPTVGASGIAAVTPEVSFSVGSRLASLNGGIANALLTQLTGTNVALSVLDYTALATARVEAFRFLDALATRLGVTAGSYDDLLAMEAPAATIAGALSGLVTGTASTALRTLSLSGRGNPVPLANLFSLGDLGRLQLGSEGAVAGLSLSALELLSAAAALADGERQATVSLGANVPNLAGLGLDLVIGDPPRCRGWFAIGPVGTFVRTAQLRLRLKSRLLGGPILLNAGVNLPIWLDMGSAEARVLSATCPGNGNNRGSARMEVVPGVVTLALGDPGDAALQNFEVPLSSAPVRLVDLLLLRVTGSARIQAVQTVPLRLDFSSADIAAGSQKTARTQTLAASLATSLLSGISLHVEILGLGLSPASLIAQTVRALIMPLAPTLDMTINAAFSALGLGVGEADVRVYGVRCHKAVLVG